MLGYKPIDQDRQPLGGLTLWPASTCLITQLADVLLGFSAADLPKTLVILPTRRLGTYLLAKLAKQRGAFVPPKIQTLEGFATEHAATSSGLRVATEVEEAMLLASLLGGYKHLRPYHEHEILHLFAEIIKEGLNQTAFNNLNEALGKDIFRSEAHLNSLGERLCELQDLYGKYYALLANSGLQTGAQAQAAAVQELSRHWDDAPGLGYEQIFMLGFTSVGKGYHELLAKMAAHATCMIWLSNPPELLSTLNPLRDLATKLGPAHHQAVAGQKHGQCVAQSFENVLVETTAAFKAARQLIQEKALAPSEIALLVTNEGDYAQVLRNLSQEMGFGDANIALEMPLKEHDVGSWLASFFNLVLARQNKKIPAFINWLLEPASLEWSRELATSELDATAWRSQVVEILSATDSFWELRDLEAFAQGSPLAPVVAAVMNKLTLYKQMQTKGTSAELSLEFLRFFGEFKFTRDDMRLSEKSLANAAEARVKDFFSVILRLERAKIPVCPRAGFFSFLSERLLKQSVRSIGEPLFGLQILSLQESRYFPFKAVFVLGASEGNLPKSLPKDELLDDYLKRAMGFSGWQALQAREELTFHLLKARLPYLALTFSRQQLGQPNIASGFAENLTTPNLNRQDSLWLPDHFALHRIARPPKGIFSKEGQFAGDRDRLFSQMSATSLESLIKCPYRFLLHKLRIQDFVMPKETPDPRKEGEWLHLVLNHFFAQWPETKFTEDDFYVFAMNRLTQLTLKHGPKNCEKTALFLHLQRFAWPRFTEHLLKIAAHAGFGALNQTVRELRLGAKDACQTEVLGRKVQLIGAIDQVMPMDDVILLTDYKRRALPQQKEVRDSIAPQLSFYSFCLENGGMHQATRGKIAAGYWSILNGEWQTVAIGEDPAPQAFAKKIGAQSRAKLGDLITKMEKHWQWRKATLLQAEQNFFADQSACQNCNYLYVCRRQDSRYFEHLGGQKSLAEHLQLIEDKPI